MPTTLPVSGGSRQRCGTRGLKMKYIAIVLGLLGLGGVLTVAWACFNAPFSPSEMDTEIQSRDHDDA